MEKINRSINLLVTIPAALVLFLMMAQITVNAFMRTFMNQPILHTQELVQYIYLPIVALLGVIAAQTLGEHISTDLISKYFPPASLRYLKPLLHLVCSSLVAVVAWYTLQYALEGQALGVTAGITTIPIWPVRYLAPLAFGVLAVHFAISAIRTLLYGHSYNQDQKQVVEDEFGGIS